MNLSRPTARILLVDDDERLREGVRLLLERAGFEVREAKNGQEAVDGFRAHGADVVVCGLFMPQKDGLEAIRELVREFPEVKIIAVSGGGYRGTIDVLRVAKLMGASEVITKPFQARDLVALIEKLLVQG